MAGYDARNAWTGHFAAHGLSYPAEAVIRIFKGQFPDLKMPRPESGGTALDIGCGDGRHLVFFDTLGLKATGVEIAEDVCTQVREQVSAAGVRDPEVLTGTYAGMPTGNRQFDYVLSWNSCYYMSADESAFGSHVRAMADATCPGGWLVLSVPKRSCFIFKDSEAAQTPGYRVIRNDPFKARDGEIMRCFEDADELWSEFEPHYSSPCRADLDGNFFGYDYAWHILVAQRK